MVVCPHCKTHRLVTSKVPSDVVVVVPCPVCHELSVLFRKKVIPLNRRIIEHGTFEERKNHLAHVIAEFLETGMFSLGEGHAEESALAADESAEYKEQAQDAAKTISEEEIDKFVKIDLKCIDNPAYFRRHFG